MRLRVSGYPSQEKPSSLTVGLWTWDDDALSIPHKKGRARFTLNPWAKTNEWIVYGELIPSAMPRFKFQGAVAPASLIMKEDGDTTKNEEERDLCSRDTKVRDDDPQERRNMRQFSSIHK